MCCGYLLMPFWTFFGATLLGKSVVKTTGQAFFFIGLFGKEFFMKVSALVQQHLGPDSSKFLSERREVVIRMFKKQDRFTPQALIAKFSDGGKKLSKKNLTDMFSQFSKPDDDVSVAVTNAIEHWDENKDGSLSLEELKPACNYDGKLSLGALDPKNTSLLGKAWDMFILCLICYFFLSIIDHLAASEYRERAEAFKSPSKKRMSDKSPRTPARPKGDGGARQRKRSSSTTRKLVGANGWERRVSKSHAPGHYYYWNSISKSTQWHKPEDFGPINEN